MAVFFGGSLGTGRTGCRCGFAIFYDISFQKEELAFIVKVWGFKYVFCIYTVLYSTWFLSFGLFLQSPAGSNIRKDGTIEFQKLRGLQGQDQKEVSGSPMAKRTNVSKNTLGPPRWNTF